MEKKEQKPIFIVSDESINSYGFIVQTSGIQLDGFKKNPIMLYNHVNNNDPSDAIGTWENIHSEGTRLLASANIDDEDDFSSKVLEKVEKGIIKATSIHFDFDIADVKYPTINGEAPIITKCVLKEISLCPIPSNQNAIILSCKGEKINSKEQATVLLSKSISASKENKLMKPVPISLQEESDIKGAKPDINKVKKIISFCSLSQIISFDESSQLYKLCNSDLHKALKDVTRKVLSHDPKELVIGHGDLMSCLLENNSALAYHIKRRAFSRLLSYNSKRQGLFTVLDVVQLVKSALRDKIITDDEYYLYRDLIDNDENSIIAIENDILIMVQDWNYVRLKEEAPNVLSHIKTFYKDWYQEILKPYLDAVNKRLLEK